jgi:hypothetical protein
MLYHPPSVGQWIPTFRTPCLELECDDISIMLRPEDTENVDRQDEIIPRGPAFLSDIAYKFGKHFERLYAENRRITFVGGEDWEHSWLSHRIITEYDLASTTEDEWSDDDDDNDDSVEDGRVVITEERMLGATVTDRFKWWLFKIADFYHADEDDTAKFKSSVSFMSFAEFTAKVDDNELAPLMMAQHLDHPGV